jgi:hypothetical protein
MSITNPEAIVNAQAQAQANANANAVFEDDDFEDTPPQSATLPGAGIVSSTGAGTGPGPGTGPGTGNGAGVGGGQGAAAAGTRKSRRLSSTTSARRRMSDARDASLRHSYVSRLFSTLPPSLPYVVIITTTPHSQKDRILMYRTDKQ